MPAFVGQQAPEFKLDAVLNGQFHSTSLSDFHGKWLIVLFYPMDFTFVCPTELLAFSDRIEELNKSEAEVVGVSVDSKFAHLAWTEKSREQGGIKGLKYALIADLNKEMAANYGVLSGGVALRGLFIIDPDGVIQHATINNLGVGRSVDEALRVLHAFQYVREHGEVCPADWKPGKEGMKADWNKSKEWFGKHGEKK